MYFTYKKYLFRIFAIFFLFLSPFLAFYSLGYSFDLEEGQWNNTIDIEISTVPRGAQVFNNNLSVLTTPGSLKAGDGQLISLEIQKDGYFKEKFDIWSQPNQNTTARLEDVYFLPKKKEVKIDDSKKEVLAILSKDLVLFAENSKLYIQLYGFNGLHGVAERVTTSIPSKSVQSGLWEDLLEDIYWQPQSNLLLYKLGGNNWNLLALDDIDLEIVNVVRVSERQVVVLDTEKKIWLVGLPIRADKVEPEISFLARDIDGLGFTKSPDNLWLWRGDQVYAVPKGNVSLLGGDLSGYEYLKTGDFEVLAEGVDNSRESDAKFAVKNVHQGLVFKIHRSLYYVPDFALNQPTLISEGVVSFAAASNTVFWLDSQFGLYSLNLGINQQTYFGDLEGLQEASSRELSIYYYAKWERIFVYSGDKVISTWFDKNIYNDSVATYYPIYWIDGDMCKIEVYEGFQFCLEGGKMVSYKNTEIW